MWHRDDALIINLDDPVPDSDASSLGNATSQQAAYNAVLHAKAELVLGVRPLDLHLDNRRTGHDRELDDCLVLRVLDVGLAGGEWQADERDAVYGDYLVADVQLTAACRRTRWREVRYDDGWQHRAPARFHDHHAQDFPFGLWYHHLYEENQTVEVINSTDIFTSVFIDNISMFMLMFILYLK